MDPTQVRQPFPPRMRLDGNSLPSRLDTLVAIQLPPETEPTPPTSPSTHTDLSLTSATSKPTTGPTKESSASVHVPTCGVTMAKSPASTSVPRTKSAVSKRANVDILRTLTTRKDTTTSAAMFPKTSPPARRDAARTGTTTATTCRMAHVCAPAPTRSRTVWTRTCFRFPLQSHSRALRDICAVLTLVAAVRRTATTPPSQSVDVMTNRTVPLSAPATNPTRCATMVVAWVLLTALVMTWFAAL
ncbi:hypothetical protein BC830DRAFT_1114067 [Chytriomyces sp. MP71]|nr:hypothetical protein BC830DRAFT_1114067 [Chytriomyces sp. MP71]